MFSAELAAARNLVSAVDQEARLVDEMIAELA